MLVTRPGSDGRNHRKTTGNGLRLHVINTLFFPVRACSAEMNLKSKNEDESGNRKHEHHSEVYNK